MPLTDYDAWAYLSALTVIGLGNLGNGTVSDTNRWEQAGRDHACGLTHRSLSRSASR